LYKLREYALIRNRLDDYVESAYENLAELEPSQSFSERVVRPLFRSILTNLGRYTPAGNLELLRRQLMMAGNPGNMAVIDLLGLKMLSAIITAFAVGFYTVTIRGTPILSGALFSVAGGLVGLYIPNYWLGSKIRKRKTEISKALPNALDMLTTMVDAGLGFDIALLRLCDKWDNPLSHEFERAVSEMHMGVQRAEALRHMSERVDVPELSTFTAVLIQADQLGISVSKILHTQSEQIRLRRRQWVEEIAATMPLKMMPIIILFIFPALFAVILGPAVPGMLAAFGS
jgi:tight adherence protein C